MVEIDASSYAVGANLSQRDANEKFLPIQCDSRTLNKAEWSDSVSEHEALEVLLALKEFCMYMLSSVQFHFLTDHQALKNIFLWNYAPH